ncbi:hypothetical protein GF377_02780 [candidate division GN15 bacterium]|nr:hypothetical protein [candidate division GN15 bacterium]
MTEQRVTNGISRAAFVRRAYPYDWVILGYCLLMVTSIIAFGRPLNQYVSSLIFYGSIGLLVPAVVLLVDENRNRVFEFVRLLYPALLFTSFYRQTGDLMFLFFDQFYDWQLVAFERAVFGVHPTLYIDSNLLNVWLNEPFMFGYFMYYPMIPAFLLPLFIRRERLVIKQFLTTACIVFFASYLLFSLYPTEGPRWHFAAEYLHTVDGPVFRPMVNFVIEEGAVRGGAMPSSHTAIAVVIMLFLFRYHRVWGWISAPVVVLLAIGTFWGRFHYVSDTIAGIVMAVLATWLVWHRYHTWKVEDPVSEPVSRRTQHVA